MADSKSSSVPESEEEISLLGLLPALGVTALIVAWWLPNELDSQKLLWLAIALAALVATLIAYKRTAHPHKRH